MKEPIALKPVQDLSLTESEQVSLAVADQKDFGLSNWSADIGCRHVFAAYRSHRFVGMCCWAGMPHQAQPYVWVHRNERSWGSGSLMIDALAPTMKALGVTGIGPMPIVATGREADTAMRLAARLRSHFREEK